MVFLCVCLLFYEPIIKFQKPTQDKVPEYSISLPDITRVYGKFRFPKWKEEHHVKHVQMERSKKKNDNNRKYIVHMAVSFGGRGYSKGIIFGKKSSFSNNPF